jgi:nitrogenase delta subunit
MEGKAMAEQTKEQIEQLVDYIMKKCLWQFHSRSWDRVKQNENILLKTSQILCEEPVDNESPMERCYWVDAMCLADAFKARYSWLARMDKSEIKELMQGLKERMDHLTITGSLNEELNDPHY